MSLKPLQIERRPTYRGMRKRIAELSHRVNLLTGMKVVECSIETPPEFNFENKDVTLNLPTWSNVIAKIEELEAL